MIEKDDTYWRKAITKSWLKDDTFSFLILKKWLVINKSLSTVQVIYGDPIFLYELTSANFYCIIERCNFLISLMTQFSGVNYCNRA